MNNNSLESFSSNIVNVAVVALHIKSTTYLSSILPQEVPKHKIFLYFHYLNLNFIAIFLFLANRYIKNGLLRNRVWNEVVRITKEYS